MATKDMYGYSGLSSASDHGKFAKRKRVTIIITGKGGVGKSTVMNSFLGLTSNQAGTSHWPHGTPTDLHFSDGTVNDLEVRMIELPALVHCHESEAAGITSKLVDLTSGEVDVLLYCMNITSRIDKTELDNIDSITRLLGANIWKNAVFLLTWSDVAVHNGNELEGLTESFVRAIRKELLDRNKMVTEVRSVYSLQSTNLVENANCKGITCMPVSKNPTIPQEWKKLMLQQVFKLSRENPPARLTPGHYTYYNNESVIKRVVLKGLQTFGMKNTIGTFIGAMVGTLISTTLNFKGFSAILFILFGAAVGAVLSMFTP